MLHIYVAHILRIPSHVTSQAYVCLASDLLFQQLLASCMLSCSYCAHAGLPAESGYVACPTIPGSNSCYMWNKRCGGSRHWHITMRCIHMRSCCNVASVSVLPGCATGVCCHMLLPPWNATRAHADVLWCWV
jgi:hypothetical protein